MRNDQDGKRCWNRRRWRHKSPKQAAHAGPSLAALDPSHQVDQKGALIRVSLNGEEVRSLIEDLLSGNSKLLAAVRNTYLQLHGKEPKEARQGCAIAIAILGRRPPGFFWLFAIGELVSNKPCVILAASWWVSGEGQCRDETR